MNTKNINFLEAVSISFGAIIGWGAFVMPGDLFLPTSGVIESSFAILFGSFIIALISLSYIYLLKVKKSENAGGIIWVLGYLGKTHAMIYTVFVILGYISIIALNVTAIPLLFRYILPKILSFGYIYSIFGWDVIFSEVFIASLVLAFFAYINSKEIKVGGKTQLIISLLMVLSILIIFIWSLGVLNLENIDKNSEIFEVNFSNFKFLSILAIMPWAFVGFETTPNLSDEIKGKRVMFIIFLSIFSGALFYIVVNLTTAINLDFDLKAITSSLWATGEGVKDKLGRVGFFILAISMLASILSGINGFMLTTIKVLKTAFKLKVFKKSAKFENQKNDTKFIVLAIFLICVFAPWLGRGFLLDFVSTASVGISCSYSYISFIAFKICKNIFFKYILLLSFFVSLGFILLLILPFSPAFLPINSWIMLMFFSIFMILFLYKIKRN